MRNRSAIWAFTILLAVACLYQLSFTWVTDGIENDAKNYAIQEWNKVQNTGNDEVALGSRILNIKTADGNISEMAKETALSYYEQEFLAENAGTPVYPFLGISYQKCKEQQLSLGLDLQGGMSVTLEVSIPEMVRNLAGNSRKPSFQEPFNEALKRYSAGESNDFISLFEKAYKASDFKNLEMTYFNVENKDDFPIDMTNDQIIAKLRVMAKSAIDETQRVIETRINKFGVAQPTMQKQPISGRIYMELPGAKDKNRVRNLLQSTASLEFWNGYHKDFSAELNDLNNLLKREAGEEVTEKNVSDFIEKDSMELAGMDSLSRAQYEMDKLAGQVEAESSDSINLDESGPLFSTLKLTRGGNGPMLGYASVTDTAKINRMLKKGEFPTDLALLWGAQAEEQIKADGSKDKGVTLYAIERAPGAEPRIDGEDIQEAWQDYDPDKKVGVSLLMTNTAQNDWADWTTEKVGSTIAIVLDDIVYSCPNIIQPITQGNTIITGNFSIEEAQDLATILKAGSLPAPAKIVDEAVVGSTLGKENIQTGMWSFVIALILVLVYMMFYYSKAGIVAAIALIANIFFIMGTLASMGAALTLPGIAGLVLTIGMSVDANVLIYERIREELREGKGIKLAVADGYKNAYSAIIDANITSLLTAIILAYFGSGPIQGFATTLIIGVFTSLFSAIFVTRLIFSHMLDKKQAIKFGTEKTNNFFANTKINFLGKRRTYYLFSAIIIVIGIGSLISKGLDGGVEFTGGRTYRVVFQDKLNQDELKRSVESVCLVEGKAVSPEVKTVNNDFTFEITTKYKYNDKSLEATKEVDNTLAMAYEKMGYFDQDSDAVKVDGKKFFKVENQRSVDAQISSELIEASIWAILLSLLAIFFYINFRFSGWQFGLGAIVAMFHDVLVVVGLFSILYGVVPFSLEIDQAFIAAILTVIGYSINDTVVVYDRIREYVTLHKREDQNEIVNRALNSTLSRTINTSLSTFVVLLTIFLLGNDSIKGFSFALMVGVVVGTYSSICIATPSVLDLAKSIMPVPKENK